MKRHFAIEVDEYDKKEGLIHKIYSKSRVGASELFATDMVTAVSLLSSLEGKQIYPTTLTKKEVFEEATDELKAREGLELLPDGEYRLNRKIKGFGEVNGRASVKRGVFTLLKGSLCANATTDIIPTLYNQAVIKDNILQKDFSKYPNDLFYKKIYDYYFEIEKPSEEILEIENDKGFWETTAEIAAHARPIIKKIVVGVALGGLAVLAFNALSPKPSEEVIATEDQDYDSNVIDGEFTTTNEE